MYKKIFGVLFFLSLQVCADSNIPQGFGVPFSQGMSNFEWYRDSWTRTNQGWALAADLYNKYIINDLNYSILPRIPKVIHQIWIGSPLPDRYLPLIASWKEAHPDWQYILWDDSMIEALDLVNKDQYKESKNWGQKADIARYEILYRFGGVYVDIDFECLRPLDVFSHVCDYYTGVAYSGRFSTFNGLIGSAPGNPIVKECIDTLDINTYYEGTAEHNILFTSGPFHQTRCFVAKAVKAGRAVAFPVNYFYPWPFSKKDDNENLSRWFRPETFAIHYWHAGWREEKPQQKRTWSGPSWCNSVANTCSSYSYNLAHDVADFFGGMWEALADSFIPCDEYSY